MNLHPILLAATTIAAAAMTVVLIVGFMPLCRAYALAHPTARSSHRTPTPQGGGAAVVISTLCVGWCALIVSGALAHDNGTQLALLSVATVFLTLVGAADDVRGLSAGARLASQFLAAGLAVAWISNKPILPMLPGWLEYVLLVLGMVWFVNLVNFMDGIDWMTVAEVVPVAGAVALIGWLELLSPSLLLFSAALLGAMIGFSPFNRPVARLFLGDVGSLPIGLLVGWLLLSLATHGHLVAAILLPLYYLADATLTLLMRMSRREPFWEAHRSHFYQRAVDGEYTVGKVVGFVVVTNVGLTALALISVSSNNRLVSAICLMVGVGIVGALLGLFERASRARR